MSLQVDLDKLTGPHPGIHRFDKQLTVMQDIMFLEVNKGNAKPGEKAACVRAWEVLEERKRIRAGRLKPGSINARDDSQVKPKKKRKSSEISALPSPRPADPNESKESLSTGLTVPTTATVEGDQRDGVEGGGCPALERGVIPE